MEVYVSIDGVLRNFLQKFTHHYEDHYLDSEAENEDFEYKIRPPIQNDFLLSHFSFQSTDEFNYFLFNEFVLEIFGYAGISYSTAFTNMNSVMFDNRDVNFTFVGLDEHGKARSATLFFLSKNGFTGKNIRFIESKDIKKEWRKCDMWITDNKSIIDSCPKKCTQRYRKKKIAVKFNTDYNTHFTNPIEINNLTEINALCSKSLEKSTISTLKP